MPVSKRIAILQAEREAARQRLSDALQAFPSDFSELNLPSHQLRSEFAAIAEDAKRLVAIHRFSSDESVCATYESDIVSMLAYLHAKPITSPGWGRVLERLKGVLQHCLQRDLPLADRSREATEASHTMYVGGVDRVSEGESEIDFDIPEASVMEQVLGEIELIVRALKLQIDRENEADHRQEKSPA